MSEKPNPEKVLAVAKRWKGKVSCDMLQEFGIAFAYFYKAKECDVRSRSFWWRNLGFFRTAGFKKFMVRLQAGLKFILFYDGKDRYECFLVGIILKDGSMKIWPFEIVYYETADANGDSLSADILDIIEFYIVFTNLGRRPKFGQFGFFLKRSLDYN